MAELLQLELVTPQKRFLSEQVEMVVVPGELGDFGGIHGALAYAKQKHQG